MTGSVLWTKSERSEARFAADRPKRPAQKGVKEISRENQGHLKITRSKRTDKASVAEAALPG
jgi:hypothetical protein